MIKTLISKILTKLFPYKGIDEVIEIPNWNNFQLKAQSDFWGGSSGRTMDSYKLKGE